MQATIENLKLSGVGPAPDMAFLFGPRLNLFTGDNGLEKTFLLDVVWWALTRTWTGNPALPFGREGASEIEFSPIGESDATPLKSVFDASLQTWKIPGERPVKPGLVIYARVDGGFSPWDPARNYSRPRTPDPSAVDEIRPEPFHFSTETLWNGLEKDGKNTLLCGCTANFRPLLPAGLGNVRAS